MALPIKSLPTLLRRIPLFVEVWCREFSRKDALLGVAEINLSSVFTAEKVIAEVYKSFRQLQVPFVNEALSIILSYKVVAPEGIKQ